MPSIIKYTKRIDIMNNVVKINLKSSVKWKNSWKMILIKTNP